jgi:DNA-binding transcriptional ArsR family regulator
MEALHPGCRRVETFEWTRAIRDAETLAPTQKLVALTLATHMDKSGERCFPSISRLTRETGLSKSTLHRALAELAKRGYLLSQQGGRRLAAQRYATVPEPTSSPTRGTPTVDEVSLVGLDEVPPMGHRTTHCEQPKESLRDSEQPIGAKDEVRQAGTQKGAAESLDAESGSVGFPTSLNSSSIATNNDSPCKDCGDEWCQRCDYWFRFPDRVPPKEQPEW